MSGARTRRRPPPLWLLAAALGACDEPPSTAPGSSAAVSAAPAASVSSAEPVRRAAQPQEVRCRALRVSGVVTRGGKPLTAGSALFGTTPLELGEGARVDVKDTRSTREYSVHGPGRAVPCWLGEETWLLAAGRLETSPLAGTRPGAEVVVGTPHGTLAYSDAQLEVEANAARLSARLERGAASLRLTGATEPEGLSAKAPREHRPKLAVDSAAMFSTCQEAAEAALRGARALDDAGVGPRLGELARDHIRARRRARDLCAAAGAATLAQAKPGADAAAPRADTRFEQIQDLERRWRSGQAAPTTAGSAGTTRP